MHTSTDTDEKFLLLLKFISPPICVQRNFVVVVVCHRLQQYKGVLKSSSYNELLCENCEILCRIPQWSWPSTKAIIFQGDIYGQLQKPCNGSNKEALKGPEAQLPVSTD